jgi:hypothetical protein
LNQIYFYEVQYGDYAVEDDFEGINFNPSSSSFPKFADVETSEMRTKILPVNERP